MTKWNMCKHKCMHNFPMMRTYRASGHECYGLFMTGEVREHFTKNVMTNLTIRRSNEIAPMVNHIPRIAILVLQKHFADKWEFADSSSRFQISFDNIVNTFVIRHEVFPQRKM